MPSSTNFSLGRVHDIIHEKKQSMGTLAERFQNGPLIAYLPQGQHKIRWFLDPDNEWIREVIVHQVAGGLRTLCPKLDQTIHAKKVVPTCEICDFAQARNDWKLKAHFHYITYGHVVETSNISDYWRPGHSYLIIGRDRMQNALIKMAAALSDHDESLLENMLNPSVPGCVTRVSVGKRWNGYVEITSEPEQIVPSIKISTWYKPLGQCWVPEEFNSEIYQSVVAHLNPELTGQSS